MKVSTAVILLSISGSASALSVSRSSIRNLGQKSVVPTSRTERTNGRSDMKMEDFGLMKDSKIGFDALWGGEECICETALEKRLNKDGLRFRMNRTPEECEEVGRLGNIDGVTLNLPIIGETYIGPPKVASIWEALGFTATSNNAARQREKKAAVQKCMTAKDGVSENQTMFGPGGGGADTRKTWLDKYGYPRLVGTGGIFYADQLSSDAEPSGGFNMGKSGKIWPVPESVERGHYGGSMGWGMKKKGPAIDGLAKEDMFSGLPETKK